jgi:Short C-terminal domain
MPGLIRGMARTAVIAGTATSGSNRVSRRQYNRWSQQDEQQAQQEAEPQPPPAPSEPAPAAAAAPAAGDDRIAKLQQLGDLKAQGILTDEEFAAEKARILNS